MPTVARIRGHRFFFYSNEDGEPPHVHVQRGSCLAKVWLEPVRLARSRGFRPHEQRRLTRWVEQRRGEFLEAWNGYFI